MRLVIVTGMSGAGKTQALKMLEDMGFYCVDNLPIPLIETFAELTMSNQGGIRNAALGIDIRSGEDLSVLNRIFDDWSRKRVPFEILFLDAGDETLIKRYKETRRAHPLAAGGRIDSGIEKERVKLGFLKEEADYIIDTSRLLTKELRQELEKIFINRESYRNLYITILSFGFKYGIPSDADLVFDVRFLPNPYYAEELRPKTGEEKEVRDYVMQHGTAALFLDKLNDMLEFLIPNYVLEGKNQLVIAIGCTGGKHRSVTIARSVYDRFKSREEFGIKIEHRDIDKDNIRKRMV
ncbi:MULTISPECIES: RNase adapter RapZ [Clostridia]|uniref:RNase adapter RapZ n=1 Tax=Clostridia TaxID=186801 RepID=UPI0007405E33|nr:RNase adapter RapZ [Lachnospiraceae bacterium]MSS08538.1 RNase adapter RapZ [Clostridium sp. WB02_MRS01]CUX66505.1 glmZ(sRNA)-inactivating NTPase [Clostridium sp. C105KSO15]